MAGTMPGPDAGEWINGSSIMITGGTGSFGRRFVKTVLEKYTPRRVIVFSRDEQKHFDMMGDFPPDKYPSLRFFIGDVRDRSRLELAMRDVDVVIHAAAQKHVPLAEYNPFECINTNVNGAENVVRAAIGSGVKRVVALSTDKACNPVNLYGASKLASDKVFVAGNNLSGRDGCRFSIVRYGNVVGSRGSVVPFFRRLIREGAPYLPITDERMTRFWITLDQGVDFVLSSLAMMSGGEIFVPRIPSMKMIDLAKVMAPHLPIEIVGIRPGEKLHEVMVAEEDSRHTVALDDRYVIMPNFAFYDGAAKAAEGGTPVPEGFRYASDSNDWWLTEDEMRAWLDGV